MLAAMIWWDWTSKQRWACAGVIYALGCLPWLLLSLQMDFSDIAAEWQIVPVGGLFMMLFMVPAWFLFVGLKTGRIPPFGPGSNEPYDRQTQPFWFWFQAVLYVVILGIFVRLVIHMATYTPPQGG